jgi:hypothetical protein
MFRNMSGDGWRTSRREGNPDKVSSSCHTNVIDVLFQITVRPMSAHKYPTASFLVGGF